MKIFDILRESSDFSEARSKLKMASKAIDAALNHKAVLYRGVEIGNFATKVGDLPGDYVLYYVSGRKEPRRSLTGTNLFLDITSKSEAWKDIPRRAFSTFCSVDPSSVGDFGDLHIILPINSVNKFAVCEGDFNMTRFKMMGDNKLTVGNFINDVASLAEKATNMLRIMQFYISHETLVDFTNATPKSVMRFELDKIARGVGREDLFQKYKQEIKDSKLLALLEKHGKILARSIGSQAAKPEAIDAVGEVIIGLEKIREMHKDDSFERLMNILDYEVNLLYRAEYFVKVFGKFSGSLYEALLKSVTPEKMGVELAATVNEAIEKSVDTSEIWFEGPYFMIGRGPYSAGLRSSQVKVQKYFSDDAVKEFFKSI